VSLKYDELRGLLSRSVLMVRDFLMDEVYHDIDAEEVSKEWGTTVTKVKGLTEAENPATHDLLELLNYTSLDYGIAIRDPATGKEVTFFAAHNLASDHAYDSQTEEITQYDPLDKRESGLDFLPKVHGRIELYDGKGNLIEEDPVEVDGNYNLDDVDVPSESDFQLDDPESFDVEGELGEDTIEAEFSEITQRDLDEFENKCENCLDMERLPDSMLCFHCNALGIECNPPEDPERPEDYEPLELMAAVDHHARQAEFQSRRLLRAGKLLLNKEE
jgi:hypothetical protein